VPVSIICENILSSDMFCKAVVVIISFVALFEQWLVHIAFPRSIRNVMGRYFSRCLLASVPLSIFANMLTPRVYPWWAKTSAARKANRIQKLKAELAELTAEVGGRVADTGSVASNGKRLRVSSSRA
jgi:hypothetical protein